MRNQRYARTHNIMKLLPIFAISSLFLLSACGSTADGTKTIKIEDDATVGDDLGASDIGADATSTQDGKSNDVST